MAPACPLAVGLISLFSAHGVDCDNAPGCLRLSFHAVLSYTHHGNSGLCSFTTIVISMLCCTARKCVAGYCMHTLLTKPVICHLPLPLQRHDVDMSNISGCFWCRNRHVPLGKVAHCLAATLATLASDPVVAQLAMQPGSNTVQALLQLITTSDDDAFAGMPAGHRPSLHLLLFPRLFQSALTVPFPISCGNSPVCPHQLWRCLAQSAMTVPFRIMVTMPFPISSDTALPNGQ